VKIYNTDCFKFFEKEKDKIIDIVLVDLPYGQTDCEWDVLIDLNKMWIELKRICKRDCIYIFFCTTKFGYKLIQSKERWFKYDLVWEKSRRLGFLNANKMPLRKHEMVYVFADGSQDKERKPLDFNQNIRDYAQCIKRYINKPINDIIKDVNNTQISHFFTNSYQFELPTEKTYNKLIEKYKINDMPGFRDYQSLKDEWKKTPKTPKTPLTYNPQKTAGKTYKSNARKEFWSIYGRKVKGKPTNTNNVDRYPHSILQFNNPVKSLHKTQKPTDLCEWLIKTYSNEGDNILDFTMGSGTTGIACINTNRNFIGVEMDKKIFKLARHRLFKHELEKIKSTAYT
jgi:DNA modification methylase